MSELLPCPFCGGEADVIDYDDECWVAHQCANGTSVETNSYATEAEAVEAWNTRHVDTCKFVPDGMMNSKLWLVCSACNGYVSADYDPPRYCPHCGKLVVS